MNVSSSAELRRIAPGRFATTQWSLVLAAGGEKNESADEALARLCGIYWYPVFAFVRRQGNSTADAEDLTQGFFLRLVEKSDLAAADRSRGRFRSFLLAACQHFLSNERDRAQALKRGGGRRPIPIDLVTAESRYESSLAHAETPERLFERQWCFTLLADVLEAVRGDCVAAGNGRLFDRLRGFLTGDDGAGTHADAAAELGMTAGAVKVAVHRLRRRYREALRRRVADTVESLDDVDDEIRHLLATLASSKSGL